MNNFKKDGFRKGGSAFGGKPRFGGERKFGGGGHGPSRDGGGRGDRPMGERELFQAKCSSCHKMCEVPFRPTNGKPVYCRDCFSQNAPSESRFPNRDNERRGGNDFRPDTRPSRDERPVRHEEVRAPRESGGEDIKRHLVNLESKVDYILTLLKSKTEVKSEMKTPVLAKVEAVSTESVKTPKKVRKPKTVKVKAPAKKKVTKKKAK